MLSAPSRQARLLVAADVAMDGLGLRDFSARLLDESLALLFQTHCVYCGALGVAGTLCPSCATAFPVGSVVCGTCGEPTPQAVQTCGRCVEFPTVLTRIRSCWWLTDSARAVIHRIKYGRRCRLLEMFRSALGAADRGTFPGDCAVLGVPMHPSKLIRRGFNQSRILAQWTAREWELTSAVEGLQKTDDSDDQASLSRRDRLRNRRGSFRWRDDLVPPDRVLLVDDVYTTGATLESAAQALRRAGVREVYGLTVFRTPHALAPVPARV